MKKLRENERVCLFCDIGTIIFAVMTPATVIYFSVLNYGV